MHYSIERRHLESGLCEDVCYVPGHTLGNGWTRHIVELAEGDTADNPCSTKGPIYGPAFVTYDCHRSGITVHVDNNAGEFYDALYETRKQREQMMADRA